MSGSAGGGAADGTVDAHDGGAPTSRYLVTDSNVRSAWMTGILLLAVVGIEGLGVRPLFFFVGVPIGPAMYYILNEQLGAGQRGLATIGVVAAFAAAVILGYQEGAVWVAVGVDLGTLLMAYGERWLLD